MELCHQAQKFQNILIVLKNQTDNIMTLPTKVKLKIKYPKISKKLAIKYKSKKISIKFKIKILIYSSYTIAGLAIKTQ